MRVLGIDTILHNTCAAVVENGGKVLSNVIQSHSFDSSRLYDLNLAHLRCIGWVIKKAFDKARTKPEKIDLVAVNNFGSQISSVAAGVSAAETISRLFKIPAVGVNHQEAHLFSCWVERSPQEFKFPIVALSSSGGHSAISVIKNKKLAFKTVLEIEGMRERGKNLPNFRGIGAVYGFVAHALGLGGQIGGASLLSEAARNGNPLRFNLCFQRPPGTNILDFTFLERGISFLLAKQKKKGKFSRQFVNDLAASFEHAISEFVLDDLIGIAKNYRAKEVHLAGGISANRVFRQKLPVFAEKIGAIGRFPVKPEYSTDNAAMTASLGYYRYSQNPKKYMTEKIPLVSNLRLEKMAIEQLLKKNRGKDFLQL